MITDPYALAAAASFVGWEPPTSVSGAARDTWRSLVEALAHFGVRSPQRTTTEEGTAWAKAIDRVLADTARTIAEGAVTPFSTLVPGVAMVRAGVAVADLFAISVALSQKSSAATFSVGVLTPQSAAAILHSSAHYYAPGQPLRSLVGWSLLPEAPSASVVAQWEQVGLGADGWLYAAAGLSMVEALAVKQVGEVGNDGLRMMAGLRGVGLPVE